MSEITVSIKDSRDIGGCNACAKRTFNAPKKEDRLVWDIQLRTIGIRLCDDCLKELMEKIRSEEIF